MGDIFGTKKAAKKTAAATLQSAQLQAAADEKNALAIRDSAELTAAATREAAAAAKEAADKQSAQIAENGRMAMEAAARQEGQIAAQASASQAAAARAEQNARDQAQGIQQQRELAIGMDRAKERAQEALEIKPDTVEVTLASEEPDAADIDPITGRRRPRRAQFMGSGSAGLAI